jgi:hypothetical protein
MIHVNCLLGVMGRFLAHVHVTEAGSQGLGAESEDQNWNQEFHVKTTGCNHFRAYLERKYARKFKFAIGITTNAPSRPGKTAF